MKNQVEWEAIQDALGILSRAKRVATHLILDEVLAVLTHSEVQVHGSVYSALETWRWVSNAYDHVIQAERLALGLDRRGDPCLPSW